jgi:hypothetical protein
MAEPPKYIQCNTFITNTLHYCHVTIHNSNVHTPAVHKLPPQLQLNGQLTTSCQALTIPLHDSCQFEQRRQRSAASGDADSKWAVTCLPIVHVYGMEVARWVGDERCVCVCVCLQPN